MRHSQKMSARGAAAALLGTTVLALGVGSVSATSVPDDAGPTSFDDLVAAAMDEGRVTVYSSLSEAQLRLLQEGFEAAYPGIDVTIARMVAELVPTIETELSTGRSGADLIVLSAPVWLHSQIEAGNLLDVTASPQLAGDGDYDAERYVTDGKIFEVGAGLLTFAWNTDQVPDGLSDFTDLLDPSLAGGKIGVIDAASSPTAVDYYLWLERSFGEEFVVGLAGQDPMIYPSALPIGEALTSGEVFAAPYAAPVQLAPAQDNGAPVDFGFSPVGGFGALYEGAIPATAANPAAAALFADFLVSEDGQALAWGVAGSAVRDGVPGAVLTNADLAEIEPVSTEEMNAYLEKWNALFRN